MADGLDYALLFASAPSLVLILAPDERFTILDATDSYLQATMTERAAIVGRPLFEVFPDNPGDRAASGVRNLRASLRRVLEQRKPDRMAVQKYDIRRPESEGGGFAERYWSPTNAPILGPEGEVRYLLHRVEDVTQEVLQDRALQQALGKARTGLFNDIFGVVSDPTLFVGADRGGVLLSLNSAAAGYFGVAATAVLGRPVEELLHSATGQRVVTALRATLQGGRRAEIEDFVAGDDGPRLRRVTITPVLVEEGKPSAALIVFHDVTAERLAIEATRASEARLRKIIDLVPAYIHVRDLAGRHLLVNKQTADLFDLTPDEMVGKSLLDLGMAPADLEDVLARDRAVAESDGVSVDPEQRITLRGAPRILHSLKIPYRAPGSDDPAVLTVALDVTEVRAAADALRLSEARYRTQFEHAPEAILTLDVDRGVFVEANDRAAELFGFPRRELLRLGPAAISASVQRGGIVAEEAMRERIAATLAGERPVFDWICRDAGGREFPIEARLVRLPGPGNLVRGSLIDISDRKRAEEERLRAADLELQVRRIREANRLKSEFLANMSHELRTPLNAVIGFASLLHDGHVAPDSPEHKEFLGDILTSGQHLLQLINDVLDLAKVESGKIEFHAEPIDLREVAAEVISILRAIAVEKRIQVALRAAPGLPHATLDPARLKQVLYNFLSNALKFTGEGGRVTVRLDPEGQRSFRLSVEDDGVGIAAADLPRLFVEFQQLDQGAAKRHQGTGLGLALTKRLVEAQGGTVGVRSILGQGSVFHAILPLAQGPSERDSLPRVDGPGSAPTILVVEDVPADRSFVVDVLAASGYSVESAATGAQAQLRLAERRFDAMTLDLILPDTSGLDLIARVRAGGPNAAIPIIVTTVVAEAHLVTGFAVQDVLHKPIAAERLVAALERAGVAPAASGPVLVVDDDAASLRLMEATLGRLGYAALCHDDGERALTAAAAEAPAAVILDLLMPRMDGFAFLERFRRLDGRKQVPVIVWTQKELTGSDREALRASVRAVIPKSGVALLEELAAHLPPRPRPASKPE